MKKKVNKKTIVNDDGEIISVQETIQQRTYTKEEYERLKGKKYKSQSSLTDVLLSKKMIFFILGLIVVLVASLFIVKAIQENELNSKASDIVQKGAIYQSIDGQSILVSSMTEVIDAKVSSTVKAVHYKQGDTVKSGQKLLELDTTNVNNEIKKLNSALKQMQKMQALYNNKYENLLVKAPVDGYVVDVRVKQGDKIKQGDLLGSYIPTTTFYVVYNVIYDENNKVEQWQQVTVSYDGGTAEGVVYDITGNKTQGQTVQVGVYITDSKINLAGKLTTAQILASNGNLNSSASANVHNVPSIPIYAQEEGTIDTVNKNTNKALKAGTTIITIKNDDIVNRKEAYTNDVASLQEKIAYANDVELKNCTIYAQTTGTIQTPAPEIGDSVVVNTQIILIQTDGKVKTEILVGPEQIGNIKEGQKAIVYVEDNGQTKSLGAVVTKKETKLLTSGTSPDYIIEVTVNTSEATNNLIGKTAKVGIILAEKRNTLFVSTDLVYDNKVYVLNGTKVEERIVLTGIQNNQYTEILEGLSEGERVIAK